MVVTATYIYIHMYIYITIIIIMFVKNSTFGLLLRLTQLPHP